MDSFSPPLCAFCLLLSAHRKCTPCLPPAPFCPTPPHPTCALARFAAHTPCLHLSHHLSMSTPLPCSPFSSLPTYACLPCLPAMYALSQMSLWAAERTWMGRQTQLVGVLLCLAADQNRIWKNRHPHAFHCPGGGKRLQAGGDRWRNR